MCSFPAVQQRAELDIVTRRQEKRWRGQEQEIETVQTRVLCGL